MVCGALAKAPSEQPRGLAPEGSSNCRETSRPNLLLASLQRVYMADNAALLPPAGRKAQPAITPTSDAARGLAIGLIETVFEVGDLDPFPYVNRRDDSVAIEPNPKNQNTVHRPGVERVPGLEDSLERPPRPAGGMAPEPASGADRRKLPRRESDCSVSVASCGHERLSPERMDWIIRAAKTRGHLVDVSMSGVAVHLTDEFASGTRVVLRIANRTLSKHVDASATVLRCRRDGEVGWNVVCRFDKNLTFEQIHLIGRNLFAHTIV